jgi:predicted DNA-binding protein
MSSSSNPKRERVIHARVPESLDDEIKRTASHLGVTVSNLVRDVLENAIGLVEDIVSDSALVARAARGEPLKSGSARRQTGGGQTPVGWQVALLNVNAVCDACNRILPKGTQAAIGIVDDGPRPFRCETCLAAVKPEDDPSAGS